MMSDEAPLAKVAFPIEVGEATTETLWALNLGEGRYQLDNTPWFAYGVSWQDVVEAVPEAEGGFPVFRRVVQKSGHRTLRTALPESATEAFLEEIKGLGCSFEGANREFIAIDVPPAVELQRVTDFLEEKEVEWEYADPTHEEVMSSKENA